MAASLPRTQIPSNNALYEKYFHQVESGNSGKVLASDAAVFLKRSGLADLVLGKIWDLADTESKGYLNKQEFFVALQLVACAQNGMEVSLSSVKAVVPPPRLHDAGSPPLVGSAIATDVPWAVKSEERGKYDAIFDSLNPVNGYLSGDKVKPVLLNSKLSVDILGRVWELSDIDRDGLLDRDEFAVAMFLVYSALEREPVPMSLPPALVPPSKRKPVTSSGSLPIIPPLPMPPSKEPRHSLPPVGILPTKVPVTQWVVSHTEKAKCDEIFQKLDKDMDGLVSGLEVREIFLKTGLPSVLLAHIWTLCDTKDCGKLSKEQFALAFHFINQKIKGIDPPHVLTPEMIPPPERASAVKIPSSSSPVADFSAIKELDTLNNEIVELQREKTSVEQELSAKEDAVKHRTSEVQDLQEEVERETINLQNLKSQKQEVQEILSKLDEQKEKLESQLQELRLKCAEETQMIFSLKAEIANQETQISSYENELLKAKEELTCLQEETVLLEENLQTGKQRLAPLEQQLQESQLEINSVKAKLEELKTAENNTDQLRWCNHLVNGIGDHSSLSNSSSDPSNLHENTECESPVQTEHQSHSSPVRNSPEINQTSGSEGEEKDENLNAQVPEKVTFQVDPYDVTPVVPPDSHHESEMDFFQSDPFVGSDPFKDDPFGKIDPFGGDPFKDSDPFASDIFYKQSSMDPFTSTKDDSLSSSKDDPFAASAVDYFISSKADSFLSSKVDSFTSSKDDPFKPTNTDPFKSSEEDPFTYSKSDPFTTVSEITSNSEETLRSNDPFAPGGTVVSAVSGSDAEDPFSSMFGKESFGSGFADFSLLSKISSTDAFDSTLQRESLNSKSIFEEDPTPKEEVPPALPPKTGTPSRPCPPPPGKRHLSRNPESSELFRYGDPFQQFSQTSYKEKQSDPFSASKGKIDAGGLGNFSTYQSEDDMIEWAKRESEKEEEERLARLKQQEQEDLELAIALSKSEISEA
ncbi:hypothetical protein GDO86_007848 [Hymenochirus boettgeri]|uniref:Epidermal growth factor receptor pathway substrate 15 n=1 Tax=Hymenochirus boettgeri TaxID=247094 RepID=A0A8T2J0J9_9PIPI|nr:hypothetical protein GDO86_007848 [Hymenochirus boettgeri]